MGQFVIGETRAPKILNGWFAILHSICSSIAKKAAHSSPNLSPPIESAEWANALATRLNVTVMPGELSKDFLMKAIQQGSAEERQAVLDYLSFLPAPDSKVVQSDYDHC